MSDKPTEDIAPKALSPEEATALIQELRTHQVELEMHRKLFEHTPDGILVADAEGTYLDVNTSMCRMLGWTHDELVGKNASAILAPEDVERIAPAMRAIHSQPVYRREWRLRRRDGSIFPVDVSVTTLPNGHVMALVRDITARKEADEALRQTEARHAAMIANIGDVIAIVDDEGIIRYESPNVEKVLGWRPEELVGRSVWDYEHPDDLERTLDLFRAGMAEPNASATMESRYRCKDGGYKWVEVTGVNLLHDPNIRGLLTNYHDITERKLAAEHLEARNLLLDALINSPPDLVIFSVDRSYAYLAFNDNHRQEMRKVWHVDIEVGTSLLDCMTDPTLRDLAKQSLDRALGGESFMEVQHQPDLNIDYELRWNPIRQADGRIDGVTVFVRDITERARAEEALRASEARYRSILNASPDNITITDLEGRVLMTSPAAWRMFGYERQEDVVGHLMIEGIVPEDRERAVSNVLLMFQGTPPGPGEYRGLRLDQSTFDIEVNGEFIRDAAGQPTSMVFVVRDVTERKVAEESLRRSLKEKDALLREVHHRVKNNLQVINSLLRLETARNEHPSTRTVLAEMQGRIQSMALLHESLYRSGTFAGVDLGAYLKQLTTQSFRAQGHPGRIRLELDLASVAVGMDKAVPCGLLVNELVSNGLKHGFPDEREGMIRVELKSVGGARVRLCVSDTGVGLPPDFESRRGNSLGLQLVSDLAGQLGGRLELGPPPAASFAVTFMTDERDSHAPPA